MLTRRSVMSRPCLSRRRMEFRLRNYVARHEEGSEGRKKHCASVPFQVPCSRSSRSSSDRVVTPARKREAWAFLPRTLVLALPRVAHARRRFPQGAATIARYTLGRKVVGTYAVIIDGRRVREEVFGFGVLAFLSFRPYLL